MRVVGEVVLIYFQDKPSVFARIESIEPDIKKDWYRITLLFLTLPVKLVTWILRESYIDGAQFTMEGMPIRIEEVKKTPLENIYEDSAATKDGEDVPKPGKIIPFRKT